MKAREDIVDKVRERYGAIAEGKVGGCCGSTSEVAGGIGYAEDDLEVLPEGANLGLGCGAPVERLDLREGETVLDLGSGAGIDVFLAARRVGASGRAIGVDMTPEMLEKARANAARDGFVNVEFLRGRLEDLPLGDASVDAVTSNCVINLVPDKELVFREIARVLRPGGRLVVSDIVLDGELPEAVTSDLLAWVGCIAGAMRRKDYLAALDRAGLGRAEILTDVDYLAAANYKSLPPELRERIEAAGVRPADLAGKVRCGPPRPPIAARAARRRRRRVFSGARARGRRSGRGSAGREGPCAGPRRTRARSPRKGRRAPRPRARGARPRPRGERRPPRGGAPPRGASGTTSTASTKSA